MEEVLTLSAQHSPSALLLFTQVVLRDDVAPLPIVWRPSAARKCLGLSLLLGVLRLPGVSPSLEFWTLLS
eukprot:2540119-Rhodomonas_salina.1